jgi:DNA-binding response OmpR family regulator
MPAKIQSSVKPRVLVLGSDSTHDRDMVAALPSENCEIILAADCRQALDITRTGRVDVLVLDFDSLSREFSQVASKLSFVQRRCRTLVLADSLEQLTLASETGVDGVLMKPLDPDQGRTVIHNLLAGARRQALGERWRPRTAPCSEAILSRRDWEINN